MDPLTMMQALSAGAAVAAGAGAGKGLTEVVKTGIVDAYTASKHAIRARFGADEDAKETLSQLEMKPDDLQLRHALASYLDTHHVIEDPASASAVEALQVQLARVEGGIGSISTGDITDNTLRADRGGIASVTINGGATAGYTPPPGGDPPS